MNLQKVQRGETSVSVSQSPVQRAATIQEPCLAPQSSWLNSQEFPDIFTVQLQVQHGDLQCSC